MDHETKPLQQKNKVKSEPKYYHTYEKCCITCLIIIFVISLIYITFCYGERNLPKEQQICK